MKGKLALVTGSTSGIGLGIAAAFASEGADVVLNGFGDADEIERTRADMAAKHGVEVAYEGADLTDVAAVEAMFERLDERGGADILVNNAGIQHVAPLESFDPARWDKVIAVNLSAAFHTTRLALPAMRRKDFGRIVNIASAHGLVASPGEVRLRGCQARPDRADQGHRARERRERGDLQRGLPRLGADPAGAGADRRAREKRKGSPPRRRRKPCSARSSLRSSS